MNNRFKNIILLFFLTAIVFNSTETNGEYRVYQYLIRNKDNVDQGPFLDQSTLDPISYLAYHGGKNLIDISLLRTWICRGNTSYIKTCSPPQKTFNN